MKIMTSTINTKRNYKRIDSKACKKLTTGQSEFCPCGNCRATEQEKRQTSIIEAEVILTVKVAREDFPNISSRILVRYKFSSAQKGWEAFVKDVRRILDLEDVFLIIDKVDLSAVHRIQRLKDNGEYFVRQGEASCILEVPVTHKFKR